MSDPSFPISHSDVLCPSLNVLLLNVSSMTRVDGVFEH